MAQTNTFPGSGSVGIGTTTPAGKLHVSDVTPVVIVDYSTSQADLLLRNAASPWNFARLRSQSSKSELGGGYDLHLLADVNASPASAGGVFIESNNSMAEYGTTAGNKSILTIRMDADGTPQNLVSVRGDTGNVGFGTAAPATKLQLTGDNVEISMGRATVDATAYTRFGMATNFDTYWASNATYNGAWNYVSPTGWGGAASVIHHNNGAIQMDTANGGTTPAWSTRFYIANNGNVSVGAQTSPTRQFQVFGAGQASSSGLLDAGNKGGTIHVLDSGGAPYNGGAIIFGAGQGYFTGIKGLITDGSANTVGDLSIETRNAVSDTGLIPRIYIKSTGNIGIGTTNPTQKLSVNGTVRAKEVIVDTGWSDYVFKPDYKLASLSEVENAIKREGHLPGIPSAAEVAEHGVSMGDMQSKLLAKIEELTLHQIEQEKRLNAQAARITQLENENKSLGHR